MLARIRDQSSEVGPTLRTSVDCLIVKGQANFRRRSTPEMICAKKRGPPPGPRPTHPAQLARLVQFLESAHFVNLWYRECVRYISF